MTDPSENLTTHERELVAAARRGEERAFGDLVHAHRRELHAYCYRMLGSTHDAEEALQDVLLRAWRGLGAFEGRSSLRSWLYRIATNVCLNVIGKRPKRVLPVDYGPPADPHNAFVEPLAGAGWVEPYPDTGLGADEGANAPDARYELRESVELAFVAALQHLSARQRAVLILREVLGFSAREAADLLETTTASVNSALQRARQAVERRLPVQSQQAALRALGDERLRELAERYARALEHGDVDAVIAMLTEDATWSMPPTPTWFRGHGAIASFLADGPFRLRWRHVPTTANGQLAVGGYVWDEAKATYVSYVLDVLTLRGTQVSGVTAFRDRAALGRFGLPDELPG